MRRYLFIGGPADGRWFHANGLGPWLVPGRERRDRFGAPVGRTLYFRRTVQVPGWLVPLDVYVLDGMTEIPRETVLPGFAYGRMTADPVLSWEGFMNSPSRLRDAVTAFNRERLSR